jgi:predicted PurR-regulated permease PerM
LLLCTLLVSAGLYVLANYPRALAWALVLAVALWPFYDRVRRQTTPRVAKEVLPILFTALVGLAVIVPVATLTVDAILEVREIIDYGRRAEESGIPVPDFVIQLPYAGPVTRTRMPIWSPLSLASPIWLSRWGQDF